MPGNQAIFQEALRKAHNHAWDRRWQLAIAEYRRALAEIDSDPQVWIGLGSALLELKRLADAKEAYRRAADLAPDNLAIFQKLAELYESMGDLENALAAQLQIATALQNGPMPENAVDAWRSILRMQPLHIDARMQLAELLARLQRHHDAAKENVTLAHQLRDRGRGADALERARRALSLDAQNAEARAFIEGAQLMVTTPSDAVTAPQPGAAEPGKGSPLDQAVQQALSRLADSVFDHTPRTIGLQTSVPRLLTQAMDLQMRERLDEAITAYRQVISAGADGPDVRINLGQLNFASLRVGEAIAEFQHVLDTPELAIGARFGLALCHRTLRDVKAALAEALTLYERLDGERPGTERAAQLPAAYARLARRYGDGVSPAETAAVVDALVEFLNGGGWRERATALRDKAQALETRGELFTLAELVATRRPDRVLDSLRSARDLSARMKATAAVDEYYQAIAAAPFFLPLHRQLASLFAEQGRIDDAIAKHMTLAAVESARGDREDEMNSYRDVLRLAPDNVEVRQRLVDLLVERGAIAEAVDQTLAFGDVYARLAQPDRALKTYEAALRLVPRAGTDRWTLTILHLIGDIYLQRAAWKEALQVYLQIRKMAPRDDKASLRLIDLYFKLGRDPETENELAHLIALYDRTGETDKLITLVQDMAALRPRNSVLRNFLIDLLVKAGRTEQAIGELQALGEAQVSARQTRDAIQTFERLIRLAPANADSYRDTLAQLKAGR